MIVRALSSTGDYQIGSNVFLINTPAAVAQAITTRLRLWAGDWFLDLTEGTDWRSKVLGRYTTSTYDPEIRSRILGTPGVTSIVTYYSQLNRVTRVLTINATVNTLYTGKLSPVAITVPINISDNLGDFVLGTSTLSGVYSTTADVVTQPILADDFGRVPTDESGNPIDTSG